MGTKRDLQALERRRIEGARLLKRGVPQAEVARRLGVSRQSVNIWAKQLAELDGAVGKLKAKPLGRPKWLDAAQSRVLCAMLAKGALAAGFPTELWTVKRVRVLIEREFGVTYSNSGGWELLHKLGFTPQKLEKCALQRDEQAIVTWKRESWPALKNKLAAKDV
ncbi:winged helix-turn-helix domain-containing protein [Burkholderia sp. PU8-34]